MPRMSRVVLYIHPCPQRNMHDTIGILTVLCARHGYTEATNVISSLSLSLYRLVVGLLLVLVLWKDPCGAVLGCWVVVPSEPVMRFRSGTDPICDGGGPRNDDDGAAVVVVAVTGVVVPVGCCDGCEKVVVLWVGLCNSVVVVVMDGS